MLAALAVALVAREAISADLLDVVLAVDFCLALASVSDVRSPLHLVVPECALWIVVVVIPVEGVHVCRHLTHGSNLDFPKVRP